MIVGLAHEVRNPLNAIRLNLFASKKILQNDRDFDANEAGNILDESVEEIERMDDLIGQLLGYARVVGKSPSLVKINEQVDSVLRFLKHSLEQSQVHAKFEACPKRLYDFDGSPKSATGVNQSLSKCPSGDEPRGQLLVVVTTDAGQVAIDVHDSGPGLDDAIISQIFEPFFSTREDGVGMGLAVVKGLVESSKGRISCSRSELLGGMKFRIEWPSAD